MNRITREEYNALPKGDYHLCLDRLEGRWLFYDDNDYRMGMAGVALASLKFDVQFYAFELMPNHGHFVLNGTGEQCMKVFSFLKRRFSEQLMKKGRAPLPEDYGCVLKPLPDKNALMAEILYVVRNPYEKGYCSPGGHRWGSSYLYFNELARVLGGVKVSSLQTMQVRTITGSRETLPPDWLIHPDLGVLPCNFIDAGKVEELFESPKEYHTRLVKEYESAVKIARTLGEEVEFSQSEIRDIVNTELRASYPGRLFKSLSPEEKCRVAVRLYETMRLDTRMMAQALYLSELTIIQAIRSKDYGIR